MPKMKKVIPLHEQLDMLLKLHELETQGKKEEAAALKQQIPLPAYLAKFAKDHLGTEFVLSLGWSMAEAEANYGSDWLSR